MRFWALLRRNAALRRITLYQLLVGLQLGTYTLLFNLYLVALGHREDLVGVNAGVMTLALSVAALGVGWLSRRWGAQRLLAGGLALTTLGTLAQALSAHQALIIGFAVLIGAGTAMQQVLLMPIVAEHVAAEERAEAAALSSAVNSLALTFGTLLGGFLPEALARAGLSPVARDRAALLVGIAVGALGAIPILRLHRGTGGAAGRIGTSLGGPPVRTPRPIRRMIWRYSAATALISIGAGAFLPFVNVYLARLGATPGAIGGLLALTGALGAVLGLLGPALGRRVGQSRLAVVLRVAPVVPAALLLAFPTIPLVVLTHATRQVGAGMTWPIEASLLNERVPPAARAGAFGMRTAAWNVAWALSGAVSGQLIVRGGYNYPLLILVGSTVLGGVVLSLVLRPTPEEAALAAGKTVTA